METHMEQHRTINKPEQQKIRNLYKLQTDSITKENKSYPRVINTTNTHFTQDKLQLLSKGLKYNLHYKPNNWLETLALEAETAISNLKKKKSL
jgi:hypothetical protein